MAYSQLATYDTSAKPRGYGIIIVNKFERYGALLRESADNEIKKLTNLVISLGLIQELYQDLTKDQILSLLQNISQRQEFEKHSMFFIAICSHGGEDGIYGVNYGDKFADSKAYAITVGEIKQQLNSNNCPGLSDKPKLIIINGYIEKRVRTSPHSPLFELFPSVLRDSDSDSEFLTIYPTLSGYYEDIKHESLFIDVLCEILLKYDGHEITQLLPVINGILMKSALLVKIDGANVKLIESCVMKNTLSKMLCLTKEEEILPKRIEHAKFKNVYEQKKDSQGLALFILFSSSKQALNEANKICKQIELNISDFSFVCKFIRTFDTEEFSKEFYNAINSVNNQRYSNLITFIIGERAEYSKNNLSYLLKGKNSIDTITHEDINIQINRELSVLKYVVPAIVLYTWISPDNPTPPQGINTDTFFCHASNSTLSLPQGVHPHQFVLSLYEILTHSPNEAMLLTEFFTETRDLYFNNFPTNVKSGYNSDATFYSKNTLRYPVLVKVDSTSIKSKDNAAILPGLFVVVKSNTLLDRRADMREIIGNLKTLFVSLSYTVGEDVMLTDEYNYSLKLSLNKDPVEQYRCVFILLISTGRTAQNISFADGTEINVDTFMNKIGAIFHKIPKVIISSHLVEVSSRVEVREYEHMFVVHSIEPSLSENSLIYNFSMEIQANYFAELHSILRSSIVHSTQASWIQIVDGFRKNFYINYHGHLVQLLNKESNEFRKSYEKACQTGTEPFKFYRLMIVGPENTGKTSLLRVLTGQTFQEMEKTTGFVDKYTVEVQKMSNEWFKNEDLSTYMNNIKETHQDLAMKVVAKWMSRPTEITVTPNNEPTSIVTPQTQSSVTSLPKTEPTPNSEVPGLKETAISNTTTPGSVEKFDSTPHEKIESTLKRIQSLGSKSDFFTAWDFAGQNYLYCFHSLFLSPRSVYLLLVDLTIEDLNSKIKERHRDDRNEKRSKTGVPETYLQVYEFWLNAIYSVSKTGQTSGHYTTTKIIFVFSKADEVKEEVEKKAIKFLNIIRKHVYPKNNSFSLVHEHEMFILSCKSDSPYFQNISKLKSTIKQLSDKVAFKEPIPIKWLNLANDILRDDQPIIDKYYVQSVANKYKCSDELDDFLHFFNDIGFLFYKQNKIIIDIQKLLNLIHCILFPQFVKNEKRKLPYTIQDVTKLNEKGQLSNSLFQSILANLELTHLKEHLLSLLLSYGILIRNEELGENSQNFYVPYLTIGSLDDLKQRLPDEIFKKLKFNSTFLIFFPDGFLPASLYFTLISKCLEKNQDEELPPSHLGFDCAIFYVSKHLLVYFEFYKDRTNIIVSFHTYDTSQSFEDDCNLEIINYLKFLQLSIVEIQTLLIPCGNLAKLMFVCDTCDTLSLLEKGERPTCSLDIVFSINVAEILSELKVAKPHSNASISTVGNGFCCNNQLIKASNYIKSTDLYSELKHHSYDNDALEDFILDNQDHFKKNLKWWKLSYPLYSNGLITIQRFSSIIYFGNRTYEKSNDLFWDLFHKGPLWAVKLYVTLYCNRENPGNQNLVKFIHNKCPPFEKVKNADPEASIRTNNNPIMYRMNRNRHGIAFIVNIENFQDGGMYPKRIGSNHDLVSLISLFKVLQYDSKVYVDVTRLEFVRAIKSIQLVDHSMYDSFFCVIMSHGNEKEEVIFSNNKTLSKCKIVNQFSPRYCKGLESKPRVFIFQACRGSERKSDNGKGGNEFGTVSVREIMSYKFPAKIDETVDTFIGDSTLDQYVSYRSESEGTYYIQSLCSVMQYCSNLEFVQMTEVRRRVGEISEHKQCTEDTSHLEKNLYF